MLRWGGMIALVVVLLDQVSKVWAEAALAYGRPVEVFGWFNLTLVYNRGAAFSFLSQAGGWQRGFFILIGLIAVAILAGWLRRLTPQERWQGLGLALILGGAVGNLIDRARHGHVVDFIDWHYAGWHWPTFNVADSAITAGVVLLLLTLVWGSIRGTRS
ncbi:MAG TPA: signal peptidase II [Thiohalobacter sp.]|nr:signal peptidase II [Thiohalobacter sp.]